jgi:hypothetical protein
MGISKIQIAITPPPLVTDTSYLAYMFLTSRGVDLYAFPAPIRRAYSKLQPFKLINLFLLMTQFIVIFNKKFSILDKNSIA